MYCQNFVTAVYKPPGPRPARSKPKGERTYGRLYWRQSAPNIVKIQPFQVLLPLFSSLPSFPPPSPPRPPKIQLEGRGALQAPQWGLLQSPSQPRVWCILRFSGADIAKRGALAQNWIFGFGESKPGFPVRVSGMKFAFFVKFSQGPLKPLKTLKTEILWGSGLGEGESTPIVGSLRVVYQDTCVGRVRSWDWPVCADVCLRLVRQASAADRSSSRSERDFRCDRYRTGSPGSATTHSTHQRAVL